MGDDWDNISERISELFNAITVVESSEQPNKVPTHHLDNIIHDLKLGTVDALIDIHLSPTEICHVPTMHENEEIKEILQSTDDSWTQMTFQDVEDYLESIQPAMKKFIAVPLDKDGGGEAFTIELSESDAEPLLSNMLLNKAEAALTTKEQCCQLDSPSCQMSTLLLADAATQLETNLTRKKRSGSRQRSHTIHAQNTQPYTSQCRAVPGNPPPQCSVPNRNHDTSQSYSPSPSYCSPYHPPPPNAHQGPPPHPPQKYVTYQMYPQQQQPCPPPPPPPPPRPMQFQPRGPMRPGMSWRPAISSQATRPEHRMAANFRPQSAPRMTTMNPTLQQGNKMPNHNTIKATQGPVRALNLNGSAQDATKVLIQGILKDGTQDATKVTQGNIKKSVSSGNINESASPQGIVKTTGAAAVTRILSQVTKEVQMRSLNHGTMKLSPTALREAQNQMRSANQAAMKLSPTTLRETHNQVKSVNQVTMKLSPTAIKEAQNQLRSTNQCAMKLSPTALREAQTQMRSASQGTMKLSPPKVITQGGTKIVTAGTAQSMIRASSNTQQCNTNSNTHLLKHNAQAFPVKMANINFIRTGQSSSNTSRVLHQMLKSNELQQNGQKALDLSKSATSAQNPPSSSCIPDQQSMSPSSNVTKSNPCVSTTLIVSRSEKQPTNAAGTCEPNGAAEMKTKDHESLLQQQ